MAYRFPHSRIFVFAKAPIPGISKTRMQPFLNAAECAELQQALTLHTLQTLCHAKLAPVQLWCSPDIHHPFHRRCAEQFDLTLKCQSDGHLGQRMHAAFKQALATCDSAIAIGVDCPSLTDDYLNHALTLLERTTDLVIGPAQDGGYVLIGLRNVHTRLFENITWGSTWVLQQTLDAANDVNMNYQLMQPLLDLDTAEDLYTLYTDDTNLSHNILCTTVCNKISHNHR